MPASEGYGSISKKMSVTIHLQPNGTNIPLIFRIQEELVDISLDPLHNITAGPKGGNLHEWIATIIGPPSTPYSDGVFFLDIDFPIDYPLKPPKLTFRTRIYHCNINSYGNIALQILEDLWYPEIGIRKVLQSVASLLINANLNNHLMPNIAHQYAADRNEHDRIAAEWTKRYAN